MPLITCPDCSNQVSDSAPTCPQCGRPMQSRPIQRGGIMQAPPGMRFCASCKQPVDVNVKVCPHCGKKTKKTSILAIGCLMFIGLWVLSAIVGIVSPNKKGTSTTTESQGSHATMAGIQCQNYVKDRLHSPSTADFPFLGDQVTTTGNDSYVVRSYVDAQNGFGATVRSDYVCQIRFNGGEDADQRNWTLLDLTVNQR